jgi:hypothetical protein
MTHFKKSFPSRYLQLADLDEGPIIALIKNVTTENIGPAENAERKLVVHFHEPDVKALVCNLTRAEAIAEIAGSEDTEEWPGTKVRLVRGMTRYQGKKVGCIVVERPTTSTNASDESEVGF